MFLLHLQYFACLFSHVPSRASTQGWHPTSLAWSQNWRREKPSGLESLWRFSCCTLLPSMIFAMLKLQKRYVISCISHGPLLGTELVPLICLMIWCCTHCDSRNLQSLFLVEWFGLSPICKNCLYICNLTADRKQPWHRVWSNSKMSHKDFLLNLSCTRPSTNH